jgi:hypothetical protein
MSNKMKWIGKVNGVYPDGCDASIDSDEIVQWAPIVCNGKTICLVTGDEHLDDDEFDARAQLIAATPDLLEALENYANPLNWEVDEQEIRRIWREPGSSTPEAYNGFEIARAAIAKAKGEQP